jgi:hypothetical protein
MTVSGLSVVAGAISAHMRAALGRELALLLGLGLFALPVLGARNGARRILVAWTATALTCLVCRAVRVEPDTGSASLYVMPALLGLVTPASGPGTRAFLCALAAAMLPLLFTGAAPVTRVATIAAVSLVSVAGVAWLLRAGGADRRAAGLVGLVRSAIGGEAHGSSRAT